MLFPEEIQLIIEGVIKTANLQRHRQPAISSIIHFTTIAMK